MKKACWEKLVCGWLCQLSAGVTTSIVTLAVLDGQLPAVDRPAVTCEADVLQLGVDRPAGENMYAGWLCQLAAAG